MSQLDAELQWKYSKFDPTYHHLHDGVTLKVFRFSLKIEVNADETMQWYGYALDFGNRRSHVQFPLMSATSSSPFNVVDAIFGQTHIVARMNKIYFIIFRFPFSRDSSILFSIN